MCGICGVVNGDGKPIDRDILALMRDAMVHRGPDDYGEFVDHNVGLAMRRLSVIDVEGGHQPIFNEDRSICVVVNGEIYNYRELRSDLQRSGHTFKSDADTEVIVHLYEERGADFLDQLNGMFALAVWDRRERQLILARDRLGIKPLYFAHIGDTLLFASELKSLLQHPRVSRDVDPVSIAQYLALEYIPAPRSAFRQVSKLLPASRLLWKNGKLSREQYWDVHFETDPALRDEATCNDAIRHRLREAVRLQLRSDVPLGLLLSGGMDSSSIAAMMHQLDTPISSFSIGFEEQAYNELDAANLVAKHFGTSHHCLQVTSSDVVKLLPRLMDVLDEPLADASVIPTFAVCQLAREHVTVALSGDGGDECFGGYATYQAHKIARSFRHLPEFIQRGLRAGANKLPVSSSHRGFSFKAQKFAAAAHMDPEVANALWWGAYTPDRLKAVAGKRLQELGNGDCFTQVRATHASSNGKSLLDRIFYMDLKMYLQDDLLVKVDRMSMAHSLEVRVPFLDHTFVEFAATIPSSLKVKGLRLKYILKKAMRPFLPKSILHGPKRGFDIPLDSWLRGPLREFACDVLAPGSLDDGGFVDSKYVRAILDEHLSGRRNNRQLLWPIIVLEVWRRKYS